MNDKNPSHLSDRELPEWLQREADEARARKSEDRIRIAIAVFAIGFSGVLALIAIARNGGLI